MKLSASHLKRYRQIASLLWKYGRSDLAKQMSAEEGFGVDELPSADGQASTDADGHALPEQLTDDLEVMGPDLRQAKASAGWPPGFVARCLLESIIMGDTAHFEEGAADERDEIVSLALVTHRPALLT